MQLVNDSYKNYINSHFALASKTKIVVDGLEYLGDVVKSSPKFSHSNTTFIGGFPTKTVNFEMLNFENDINFENKEVTIYKGLVINGEIEFVKQGVFIPRAENIETNINARTISFKNVADKSQLLEDKYESDLDWKEKHSGLEIVEEICTKKNIVLENTNFHFSSYMFNQPNFKGNITYREVISRLAEIGGEIAFFNNNGNLTIKSQNVTNDIISKKRYSKLTKENAFSPNLLVLGNKDFDNDIMYPNPKPDNSIEFRIEDNPFVDLNKEEIIEDIANYILNMSYTPFELVNFVDGYIYELNDVISVMDKKGNPFNAVILDISTTSRIRSKIKAPVKGKTISKYELAGSNKKALKEVSLSVNHIDNLIKAMASDVEKNNEKVASMEISVGEISSYVSSSQKTIKSDTEPTDTTMLWIDTTTNELKQHTEDGWVVINDYSNEIDNFNMAIEDFKSKTESQLTDLNEVIKTMQQNSTSMTMTDKDIEMRFDTILSQIQDSVDGFNEYVSKQSKYINFDGGIKLGDSGSDYSLRIENDKVVIYYKETPSSMWDKDVFTAKQLNLGNFAWIPESNGSLSLRKVVN